MGLFNLFKKNKVDPKEVLKDVSVEELAKVIGEGSGDDNAKKSNPALTSDIRIYSECFGEYFKKLVFGDVSRGGFGGKENLFFDSLAESFFEWSVRSEGIHGIINVYGKLVVYNYKLEFLRNYIRSGNTTPLKKEWVKFIFEMVDDETSPFGEKAIGNCHHDIYNHWIYKGDDDFVLYKLKTAIFLNDPAKLSEWGLYRPDKNGNPSSDFITIDDLTQFDNQGELMAYLDSLQTVD